MYAKSIRPSAKREVQKERSEKQRVDCIAVSPFLPTRPGAPSVIESGASIDMPNFITF